MTEARVRNALGVLSAQLDIIDGDRSKMEQLRLADDNAGVGRVKCNVERTLQAITQNMRQLCQLVDQLPANRKANVNAQLVAIERRMDIAVRDVRRVHLIEPIVVNHAALQRSTASNPFDEGSEPEEGNDTLQIHSEVSLAKMESTAQDVQERAEHSEAIARDISDLHEVMTDLAMLVHSHQDTVDSIEANVERAQGNVQDGASNVKQAAKYNASVKYPLAGAAVGAVVLAGPVGLAAGWTAACIAALGGGVAGVFGGRLMKQNVNSEAERNTDFANSSNSS